MTRRAEAELAHTFDPDERIGLMTRFLEGDAEFCSCEGTCTCDWWEVIAETNSS